MLLQNHIGQIHVLAGQHSRCMQELCRSRAKLEGDANLFWWNACIGEGGQSGQPSLVRDLSEGGPLSRVPYGTNNFLQPLSLHATRAGLVRKHDKP